MAELRQLYRFKIAKTIKEHSIGYEADNDVFMIMVDPEVFPEELRTRNDVWCMTTEDNMGRKKLMYLSWDKEMMHSFFSGFMAANNLANEFEDKQ